MQRLQHGCPDFTILLALLLLDLFARRETQAQYKLWKPIEDPKIERPKVPKYPKIKIQPNDNKEQEDELDLDYPVRYPTNM